jgi:hypothetical protein
VTAIAAGVTMRLPRRPRLIPAPPARDAEAMERLAAVILAAQKAQLDRIEAAIRDGLLPDERETPHDRHAR